MHRVKGLEFQYMFVAGMNRGVMPLKQVAEVDEPIARQEGMVAEKCLLYVALTRAQRGAFITSYGKK
jgi:superfamily I DNA/RNA helicase